MRYNLKNLWGEPVAFWAVVQTVLAAANSFGWLKWLGISGQEDMAKTVAVVSAVAAVHLALFTHRTLLAPLVQLIQAFVAFLAIYGTHVSTEQTALLVGVLTAVVAAWHRNSVSPLDKGSFTLAA